jgi:hypothetical protein
MKKKTTEKATKKTSQAARKLMQPTTKTVSKAKKSSAPKVTKNKTKTEQFTALSLAASPVEVVLSQESTETVSADTLSSDEMVTLIRDTQAATVESVVYYAVDCSYFYSFTDRLKLVLRLAYAILTKKAG